MLFVDGENFAIRAQKFATRQGFSLSDGAYYLRDVFVWIPGTKATERIIPTAVTPLQPQAIRAYYYTSAIGDEMHLTSIREKLFGLSFSPEVFKKPGKDRKAKAVDISLAKDLLGHAHRDNFDVAVLIAGDGDYVPLVEEVKRLGKVVDVMFFRGTDLGLNPELRLAADTFHELNTFFRDQWHKFLNPSAGQATA